MKCIVFGTKTYDRDYMEASNELLAPESHELIFTEARLSLTTVGLATGAQSICTFVNDQLDAPMLSALNELKVKFIALRCAGFNQIDLVAAKSFGMQIARVPAYSPHAVAEHAVALLLAVNRCIPRACNRVRDHNFELEGLVGADLNGKTVAVIGTGKIGQVFAKIMGGFGCRVIAYDLVENPEMIELGVEYLPLTEIWPQADVVSLHCPLTSETYHLLNETVFQTLKPGCLVVNTSRGAVLETNAAIKALKSKRLGGIGLDVYEEEEALFFADRSSEIPSDDTFVLLNAFPNVVITAHQAFLTHEALTSIANTTLENLTGFSAGQVPTENVIL